MCANFSANATGPTPRLKQSGRFNGAATPDRFQFGLVQRRRCNALEKNPVLNWRRSISTTLLFVACALGPWTETSGVRKSRTGWCKVSVRPTYKPPAKQFLHADFDDRKSLTLEETGTFCVSCVMWTVKYCTQRFIYTEHIIWRACCHSVIHVILLPTCFCLPFCPAESEPNSPSCVPV